MQEDPNESISLEDPWKANIAFEGMECDSLQPPAACTVGICPVTSGYRLESRAKALEETIP